MIEVQMVGRVARQLRQYGNCPESDSQFQFDLNRVQYEAAGKPQ